MSVLSVTSVKEQYGSALVSTHNQVQGVERNTESNV